jgi:hypothetical protein
LKGASAAASFGAGACAWAAVAMHVPSRAAEMRFFDHVGVLPFCSADYVRGLPIRLESSSIVDLLDGLESEFLFV